MSGRRDFLSMTAGAVAAGTVLPVAAAASNPDAELIRMCAQHEVNVADYERYGGYLEFEECAFWAAYKGTRDLVTASRPKTLAGMQAKARAAKAEAIGLEGEDNPEASPAAVWAWDLLNDLLELRLSDGGGS